MNLYETLGVAQGADLKTIRAAYKRLAMLHHPDRNGDKAVFQSVQKAYAILSDPETRTHYDATGRTEREPTPEEMAEKQQIAAALQLIRGCLVKALTAPNVDIDKNDILADVRSIVSGALGETQKQLAQQLANQDKAERAARRVVSDEDTLASVLAGLAAEAEGAAVQTRKEIEQLEMATEILSKAKYAQDIPTVEDIRAQQEAAIARTFGVPLGFFGRRV